jgi:glycosyltransferase involved in cell wall biosynthesis
LGSRLIGMVNTHIFNCPPEITLTNYRLMRRDVVDRIVGYRTSQPYITGLSIMFAANPANAWVEHREREVGKSQYTFIRIATLVMRILFNYSAWPLRVVNAIGMIAAAFSFVLGLYFIGKRLFGNVQVSGWTSLIVLLSFFNGISLVILGMLGEYIVRLLNESTSSQIYHVREKITAGNDTTHSL